MTFDLIQAWMDLKAQLPELAVEGIGLKYVYPVFLGLIVLEYVNAKHLYDLKESLSGFIIGVGATKRMSAVGWGVTVRLLWAWIITIPVSALLAGLAYWVCGLFGLH